MQIALLVGILVTAFAVNVPLGRLRARVPRFSWQWFLFVHASITLIVTLRIASGLGYAVIPLEVLAAVSGQLIGGQLAA